MTFCEFKEFFKIINGFEKIIYCLKNKTKNLQNKNNLIINAGNIFLKTVKVKKNRTEGLNKIGPK